MKGAGAVKKEEFATVDQLRIHLVTSLLIILPLHRFNNLIEMIYRQSSISVAIGYSQNRAYIENDAYGEPMKSKIYHKIIDICH